MITRCLFYFYTFIFFKNPLITTCPGPVALILSLMRLPCCIHLFPRLCVCPALGTPPSRLPPPWSTSHPRLWRALGPWSGSRASNSPSLTSPLRVLTTPQSPRRAWASCTQAQAAGATVGARAGSGGVRLEPPGTEEPGQADRGQILAAGITWWSRSATEGWTSSPSCKCQQSFLLCLVLHRGDPPVVMVIHPRDQHRPAWVGTSASRFVSARCDITAAWCRGG